MSRSQSAERRYTSPQERVDKHGAGFTPKYLKLPADAKMYKPKRGAALIDILPYEVTVDSQWAQKGNLHYERTIFTHRNVGPNQDAVICPRRTVNKPCPICEHQKHLRDEDGDEDMIKALAPKERQLFNVIDLKEPDEVVQIWDISYHLFGKELESTLRNADDDDRNEWMKFFFLEEGMNLRISFEEKTFGGNTFLETTRIDFKPRRDGYDERILDDVYAFDDLLIILPYDELKALFLEGGSPEGADNRARSSDREAPTGDDRGTRRRSEPEPEPERGSRRREEPEREERGARVRGDEPDDERGTRRRGAPEPEADPDRNFDDFDAPRGRGRGAEDEPPARGSRRSDPVDEPDEPVSRRRGEPVDDDPKDDDTGGRRGSRFPRPGADEGFDQPERGSRRGARDPEPEPEPEPVSRRRGKVADEPDPEPEPSPRGRRAAREPEPEPEPRKRVPREEAPPARKGGREPLPAMGKGKDAKPAKRR